MTTEEEKQEIDVRMELFWGRSRERVSKHDDFKFNW